MKKFKLNSKKDFWKNIPLNGMLLIESCIITYYIIPEKVLKNFLKMNGDIFLIASGGIVLCAIIILSVFLRMSKKSSIGTYSGITLISIYWIILVIRGILNKVDITLSIDKEKNLIFIILCAILSTRLVESLAKSTEFGIKEAGIIWFILLVFLLFSIALSITLYHFFQINWIYLSTFLFFGILWSVFNKLIRKEYRNLERYCRYLVESEVSDAIISFIFYNFMVIIVSAIYMVYFPKTTQWFVTWTPIISVIISTLIVMKLYGNKIQLFEKYVIIISCILGIGTFLALLVMIMQKEIWGTYTGLKLIWGIVLGIDAILGLTLKWKKAFLKDLERKYNLERRCDSEIVVARIGLMLGNITTFLTFINFIFYNDNVMKKVIKILSPFLENIGPIILVYYYKGKIDEHLKIIIFNIIVIISVLMMSLLIFFVEKYICKVVFYKLNSR